MTLVIFLIIISILILVHEFGHFIVAKRAGIRVEEFGLGFPPRIFAKKIGETAYSVNALLFGGFVKLYGEEQPELEKERAFFDKPKRTRAAVIAAGVLMNFLLAVAAFSVLYGLLGVPKKIDYVKVVGVAAGSPAEMAEIQVDDVILSVDGQTVQSNKQFVQLIEQNKGEELVIELRRGGEKIDVSVVPRVAPPEGEGPLGVAITDSEIYFPPLWQRPFISAYFGAKETLFWTRATVEAVGKVLGQLVTTGTLPRDLAGPVGIFQITSYVSREGPLSVLNFLGILSINLAILNILPFPALDGGRLLFIGVEAVFGRRVVPAFERAAHTFGMILLLILLLLITIQDINRILTSGFDLFPGIR